MRYHLRVEPLWACALALCVGLAAGGCDGPAAPTRPSVPAFASATAPAPAPGPVQDFPAGSPISVLAIKEITLAGDANAIAPTIRLVETSGRGDAFVTAITFNLADGLPWPNAVYCASCSGIRVEAGAESSILPPVDTYGDYAWSFSVPDEYTGRLAVMVSYQDGDGRRGTSSALVVLPWVNWSVR